VEIMSIEMKWKFESDQKKEKKEAKKKRKKQNKRSNEENLFHYIIIFIFSITALYLKCVDAFHNRRHINDAFLQQ
jgi:hypothetical protein